MRAGLDILHVPYRAGNKSLSDFLAGVVQIHADPNTLPHVSAGKAKLSRCSTAGAGQIFPMFHF